MKNLLFPAYLALDRKAKAPYTAKCEFDSNRGPKCLARGRVTFLPYQLTIRRSTPKSILPRCRHVTNRGMCIGAKLMMLPRSTVVVLTDDINAMPRELRTAHRCLASPTIPSPRRKTDSNSRQPTFAGCGFVPFANGGGR